MCIVISVDAYIIDFIQNKKKKSIKTIVRLNNTIGSEKCCSLNCIMSN